MPWCGFVWTCMKMACVYLQIAFWIARTMVESIRLGHLSNCLIILYCNAIVMLLQYYCNTIAILLILLQYYCNYGHGNPIYYHIVSVANPPGWHLCSAVWRSCPRGHQRSHGHRHRWDTDETGWDRYTGYRWIQCNGLTAAWHIIHQGGMTIAQLK